MEEDAQQRITYLLQEIDANICAAHRSATQICGTVRRHHQILRQIHEASRVWRPLFDSFTHQPAARRATRTPSRFSRPFTPGSRPTTQQVGDEDDDDDPSFVDRDQTFKTTTLKKHQPPASERRGATTEEDSLNFSINSDNLPRMSRTPYLSKTAMGTASKTQESVSTLNSDDRGWTSPPRTEIISVRGGQPETANAGSRQISTPPSAISSVEFSSPDVGSVSQEARLQDYDDSFTAGEPTPKFELSLLPPAFQNVEQLADMLPEYEKERIEILLDMLVSRRLLRPFVVEGTMFWQQPL
ncbi:hypothetical protein BBJ29_003345 [Phytophthora kernoviae]|uniref:Uncharacterized protein n=1 Tax=Phytophthora kernoviae TaxID=325452 RepID=A0A3F2RXA9_9STRA|nr:hypothetical protein BBJ29_003345 [Phytophthora kernoviae]RLN65557.1 hypothetical protein BBP00_00002760 [Phytophthora kernoviae]